MRSLCRMWRILVRIYRPRWRRLALPSCRLRDASWTSRTEFPGNVRQELEAKGHMLTMHNGFSDVVGGGQAVMRDFAAGVNYGASDPRKDGAAVPEMAVKGWAGK